MSPPELFAALRLPFGHQRTVIVLPSYADDLSDPPDPAQEALIASAWDACAGSLTAATYAGQCLLLDHLSERIAEHERLRDGMRRHVAFAGWVMQTARAYAAEHGPDVSVGVSLGDDRWTTEDGLGNTWARAGIGASRAETDDDRGFELQPPPHIQGLRSSRDTDGLTSVEPEETWRQVFETAHAAYRRDQEQEKRLLQVCQLLGFRKAIVENALWYFELYGYVPPWHEVLGKSREEMVGPPKPKPIYDDETPDFDFSATSKWYPYGRFIVNRNVELVAEGITSKEERARRIARMLNEVYRIDTSDFTGKQLMRVLKAHKDGRLKKDQTNNLDA